MEIGTWNDDKTQLTLTKAEWESLSGDMENLKGNFPKGYGKGKESGRKEILSKLDFLELDPENVDSSLDQFKTEFTSFKEGKLTDEMKKKIKDMDVFKEMENKIIAKDKKISELENGFESFKEKTLIDGDLQKLAIASEALDVNDVVLSFKNNYILEVNGEDKVVVKNQNGNPIVDDKGDYRKLEDVFKDFAGQKKHLFKGDGTGGSGGGSGNLPPADVTYEQLKTDEQKAAYVAKHGYDAYSKLVDAHVEKLNAK